MRVWVAPDGYDNPTLWTDGPTPDFPRALLVRVPSNADLFDWCAGRADPAPKLEEPLGLGAVVLDADGQTWVRVGNPSSTWRRLDGKLVPCSDIDVVRVLSDGWAGEDA